MKFSEFIDESFKCIEFKDAFRLKMSSKTINNIDALTTYDLSVMNCDELNALLDCYDMLLQGFTNRNTKLNKPQKEKIALDLIHSIMKLIRLELLENC